MGRVEGLTYEELISIEAPEIEDFLQLCELKKAGLIRKLLNDVDISIEKRERWKEVIKNIINNIVDDKATWIEIINRLDL